MCLLARAHLLLLQTVGAPSPGVLLSGTDTVGGCREDAPGGVPLQSVPCRSTIALASGSSLRHSSTFSGTAGAAGGKGLRRCKDAVLERSLL